MQNKRLLIIGYTWPEPTTTAAGNRMQQLLHFFLEEGYQITFSSTAAESDKSLHLEALGIQKTPIQLNHSSFDSFIKKLNPDIVLFDRFLTEEQFGWRIAEFAPRALRILDTEDLHSLRHTREKAFKKGLEFTTDYWLRADIAKRELASCYRSDIVLVIATYEMQLLKEKTGMPDSILLHLPFMVEPLSEIEIKSLKPFEERNDFICIGNGKHSPNVDAIVWLKTEIWPLIRKQVLDAKLHIYGAYLPQHIQQMHNEKEGFMVHGWTESVKDVMEKARVNLAPLRFGAGLKGKLIAAMQNGTPSVTTSIGAEGMHDGFAFAGCIADDAQSFVDRSIELFSNHTFWYTSQKNGVEIMNSNYDSSALEKRLGTKIEGISENLEKHRHLNIVGQLLLHQTMASTKYMSKWIEAKNKNK